MKYHPLRNPPKWLLEGLWQDALKESNRSCHDCGAKPGKKHLDYNREARDRSK